MPDFAIALWVAIGLILTLFLSSFLISREYLRILVPLRRLFDREDALDVSRWFSGSVLIRGVVGEREVAAHFWGQRHGQISLACDSQLNVTVQSLRKSVRFLAENLGAKRHLTTLGHGEEAIDLIWDAGETEQESANRRRSENLLRPLIPLLTRLLSRSPTCHLRWYRGTLTIYLQPVARKSMPAPWLQQQMADLLELAERSEAAERSI